jgi:hypothetical protein
MACVLSILITSAFYSQNYTKRFTRRCNSSGEDAISTISSANDKRKSYSDAIVYACCFVLSRLHVR